MKVRVPAAIAAWCAVAVAALAGCSTDADPGPSADAARLDLVRVPEDASTFEDAAALVAEGGTIEIGEGTWEESLLVTTPDVTVRGADRNATVIDGGGVRPFGVVGVASGVRIENLTVTGATFYGVLVTGVFDGSGPAAHGAGAYEPFDPQEFPPLQRFQIRGVTAYNNGLYGLYAFNAQHGTITESYASGSADSGIYVGQCEECDILVQDNVAERNAVGFENANASGLVVAGNRFTDNRVGMTFISNYVEAFSPQRSNLVVGNLVADNSSADSPAQADGAFGIGIGIAGGVDNTFSRNRIAGHPYSGAVLTNTEDLAARGNVFVDNAFDANGTDVANTAADRAPTVGTCLTPLPGQVQPGLGSAPCEDARQDPVTDPALLATLEVPPGVSFLQVPVPREQPHLSASRGSVPAAVEMPTAEDVPTPAADYLSARAGSR